MMNLAPIHAAAGLPGLFQDLTANVIKPAVVKTP
jgi:hypothetical protein